MREVHRYQDTALVTDKTPERVEGSRVWFTDGSVADLDQRALVNRGPGTVRFQTLPDLEIAGARTETLRFHDVRTIVLEGGDLFFEVAARPAGSAADLDATLEVTGTEQFLSAVEVFEIEGGLRVRTPERRNAVIVGDVFVNGRRLKGDPVEGRVRVAAPGGTTLLVRNSGRGHGRVTTPVQRITATINGSCVIEASAPVAHAEITINGSGSLRFAEVTSDADVTVNGSGSVEIAGGQLAELKVALNGSGSVHAEVTVERAELLLAGSGTISVARVREESVEVHGGSGSVTVRAHG